MNKNVIKTVAAAAVTAAGVHFADDYATKTQAAPSQMTYYAVAAGAVLGSYVLRNKNSLISGALLGAGLGAAYQGYSHRPLPAATQPVPAPTKANPVPAAPAPVQYLPPAAGANSALPSTIDFGKLQQQATGIFDQIKGLTGLGDGAPVQTNDSSWNESDYDY